MARKLEIKKKKHEALVLDVRASNYQAKCGHEQAMLHITCLIRPYCINNQHAFPRPHPTTLRRPVENSESLHYPDSHTILGESVLSLVLCHIHERF